VRARGPGEIFMGLTLAHFAGCISAPADRAPIARGLGTGLAARRGEGLRENAMDRP